MQAWLLSAPCDTSQHTLTSCSLHLTIFQLLHTLPTLLHSLPPPHPHPAGIAGNLSNVANWTLLAPNDQAFNATLTKLNLTEEALLNNTVLLLAVLEYHVIPAGAFKAANLTDGMNVTTALVSAGNLTVGVPGNGTVTFTGANGTNASVVVPDISINGSVMHIIDAVLMPPLNASVNTTGMGNITSPAPAAGAAGANSANTSSPAPMEPASPAPMETASLSPAAGAAGANAASPAPMETASPAPVEAASPAPVEAASPAPTAVNAASPAPNAVGASPFLADQAVNAVTPNAASPAP
jgi:uncharacterized surface protein with fasciclin (FAS1) repeats